MKYLRPFKIYEESKSKPIKKFPTEKAAHWNYLIEILEKNGINPYDGDERFVDFCFNKCSERSNIVFPNILDLDVWTKKEKNNYKNLIFRSSVFLLPKKYDYSKDDEIYAKNKKDFYNTMLDYAKNMSKSKEERDKFMSNIETHVKFGPKSYEWANTFLEIIYNELSEYYVNDKLRVWMPADTDCVFWKGVDYPHKYDICSRLENPDGVYFLSDIEKFIDYKYGIKDNLFYQFIIYNEYIEGRYWERTWYLTTERISDPKINSDKLKRSNFGQYGMEPTENILHMINIIEHEFGNDINKRMGFPIYVDYYKKIDPKY